MENLRFKKINGTPIENVEQYVKDWIDKNKIEYPYSNIIVGCDSQIHGKRVKYSVVICMHRIDRMYQGKGAHVISADVWIKRSKSQLEEMPSKLWREAELALSAAQLIDSKDEMFKKKITVHLDFNSEKEYPSNIVYDAGIGLIKGMGYKALGKPDSQISSITADKYCR